MQPIDITKLSEIELKALKADLYAERDNLQKSFALIDNELASRKQGQTSVQQPDAINAKPVEDTKVINQAIDALVVKAPVEKPEETKDDKSI